MACDCVERLPETCPFCKKSLIYYGLGGRGVINHEHQGDTGNVIVTCDHCRKRFALSEEAMDAEAPDWKNWPPEHPMEYGVVSLTDLYDMVVPNKIDPADVNNSNTVIGDDSLLFFKRIPFFDDVLFGDLAEKMAEGARLAGRSMQEAIEHQIECGKCGTPECPRYTPPVHYCEECGQELPEDEEDD